MTIVMTNRYPNAVARLRHVPWRRDRVVVDDGPKAGFEVLAASILLPNAKISI
jgi:hypothetical protein